MSDKQLDINKLVAASKESTAAEAMFDFLGKRQRARKEMDIKRIAKGIEKANIDVSAKDIYSVFTRLEELGIGKIIYGRHGSPNRFHWAYDLKSVVKVAKGVSEDVSSLKTRNKPLPKLAINEVANGPGRITIRRGNVSIEIIQASIEEIARMVDSLSKAS